MIGSLRRRLALFTARFPTIFHAALPAAFPSSECFHNRPRSQTAALTFSTALTNVLHPGTGSLPPPFPPLSFRCLWPSERAALRSLKGFLDYLTLPSIIQRVTPRHRGPRRRGSPSMSLPIVLSRGNNSFATHRRLLFQGFVRGQESKDRDFWRILF